MRKELEQKVDEQLKESLQQLHDIEKKDLLEYREWDGSSKNDPLDQRNQVTCTCSADACTHTRSFWLVT